MTGRIYVAVLQQVTFRGDGDNYNYDDALLTLLPDPMSSFLPRMAECISVANAMVVSRLVGGGGSDV